VLDARMRLHARPSVRFAGQITGVEGYVESAAHGLVTALLFAADLSGAELAPPPRDCAVGALWSHVTGGHRSPGGAHEPQNVNWSMFPPPAPGVRKHDKKRARVLRAIDSLEAWAQQSGVALRATQVTADSLPASSKKGGGKRRRARSGAREDQQR